MQTILDHASTAMPHALDKMTEDAASKYREFLFSGEDGDGAAEE